MHDGGDWTMDLSGTVEALDNIYLSSKNGMQIVTSQNYSLKTDIRHGITRELAL